MCRADARIDRAARRLAVALRRRRDVAMPGGCNIGSRKIDMHIRGLEELGVESSDTASSRVAPEGGLQRRTCVLDFPSVGATENLLMAPCSPAATTVIENAAPRARDRRPRRLPQRHGRPHHGRRERYVHRDGGRPLHPRRRTPRRRRPHRGRHVLVAGAIGGGPVTVTRLRPGHLELVLAKLEQAGCGSRPLPDGVTVSRDRPRAPGRRPDAAVPGLPDRHAGAVHGAHGHRRRQQHHHRERLREPFHVRRRARPHGRRHPQTRATTRSSRASAAARGAA